MPSTVVRKLNDHSYQVPITQAYTSCLRKFLSSIILNGGRLAELPGTGIPVPPGNPSTYPMLFNLVLNSLRLFGSVGSSLNIAINSGVAVAAVAMV